MAWKKWDTQVLFPDRRGQLSPPSPSATDLAVVKKIYNSNEQFLYMYHNNPVTLKAYLHD